jgi:4-hydroxy-tetrahydrodipicolinate synthase
VAPAQCAALQNAWMNDDCATFEKMRDALAPLGKHLFAEPNPTLIKYAVSRIGMCTEELRLPLVRGTENARKLVDEAMAHAGIKAEAAAPRKAHA